MKQLADAAVELAENLAQDIALAVTREEHIRISARANAASQLAAELLSISSDTVTDRTLDGKDLQQTAEPGLF